ncbi:hypothetical protein ACH5RR_025499 [Cinchona calisaya]|uniref:Uncharacterized protein n=1 Tax=Cinchona calisaya TaxID=153742 RepID=A0ABD2Z303_9GENT
MNVHAERNGVTAEQMLKQNNRSGNQAIGDREDSMSDFEIDQCKKDEISKSNAELEVQVKEMRKILGSHKENYGEGLDAIDMNTTWIDGEGKKVEGIMVQTFGAGSTNCKTEEVIRRTGKPGEAGKENYKGSKS